MSTATIAVDRQSYVGSSDIAGILGISPWRTPLTVFNAKVYGITEDAEDYERAKRLRRGVRFEPLILDQYQEESGAWIVRRNERYCDAKHPFLAAEVDAEEQDEKTGEITNLEIKSVSAFASKEFGAEGTDEVPIHYVAQIQFALMVTGNPRAKLVALIGTDDLRVYCMERDEEVIAHIRERAVSFWFNNVVGKVEPEPITLEDAALRWPLSKFKHIEATEDICQAVTGVSLLKAGVRDAEEQIQRLELGIKKFMGDNEVLVDSVGRKLLSWKTQVSKRLDQAALAKDAPDIFEMFKRASTCRVFRVK